jgi:tetratricopeptide (TPR) repeat protein
MSNECIGDRQNIAPTSHMLGMVTQKLQQWDEAKHYYLKALEINAEFSDRYEQASTYGQLGNMAQELRQWDEAKQHYFKALEIFVEFGDEYSIRTFSMPRIAQIYQSTQSDDLLTPISKILNVSVEEVRQRFTQINQSNA